VTAAKKMDWWTPEEIGHNYVKCKHCYGTGGMKYPPTRKGEEELFVPCPKCRGNKELWNVDPPTEEGLRA
jgi:DnaJ-class molecular chaperone